MQTSMNISDIVTDKKKTNNLFPVSIFAPRTTKLRTDGVQNCQAKQKARERGGGDESAVGEISLFVSNFEISV